MKPKSARRFFNRNAWKLAEEKVANENFGIISAYRNRKRHKAALKALRKDQVNPASRRVYQRAIKLLS